jgi:hypothetical protein
VDEGTVPVHARLPEVREEVSGGVSRKHAGQEPRAPPDEREHGADEDPDEPQGADPRKLDEEPVEPADAMSDDPTLEVPVGRDQAGTSCFARSISCCGSNGLPMNPLAPRLATSAAS